MQSTNPLSPEPANDVEDDGIYPMRVVTRLTGLSADTVRVWERRYQAVQPSRTDGNARRYSDADVRRLILLKAATDRGHAIGELSQLADEQLVAMAKGEPMRPTGATNVGRGYLPLIEEYLEAIARFEIRRASDLLARLAAISPPRELVYEFVLPTLRITGDRWEEGRCSVVEEHLVSGQFKALLGTFVRLFPVVPNAPRILVATPQGHLHEFGALVSAMLAATRGIEPVYLGPDVPNEEVELAVRRSKASVYVLSVVRDMSDEEVEALRTTFAPLASSAALWIGCSKDHALVRAGFADAYFHDFDAFDAALAHHYFRTALPA